MIWMAKYGVRAVYDLQGHSQGRAQITLLQEYSKT